VKNQASRVYVNHKKKLCEQIGAEFELMHLDENITEAEFLKVVKDANSDESVKGCFCSITCT
jgi:methylenetetrahydrofolate dehydrogenase (NADP+)/methenyltetrahydrofolate cyclohydrolase